MVALPVATILPVVILPDTIIVVAVALVNWPSRVENDPVDTLVLATMLPAVAVLTLTFVPVALVNCIFVLVTLLTANVPEVIFVVLTDPDDTSVTYKFPPEANVKTMFVEVAVVLEMSPDTKLVVKRLVVVTFVACMLLSVLFTNTAVPIVAVVVRSELLDRFVEAKLGTFILPSTFMFVIVAFVEITFADVKLVIVTLVEVIPVEYTLPADKFPVTTKFVPVAFVIVTFPDVKFAAAKLDNVAFPTAILPDVTVIAERVPMDTEVLVMLPTVAFREVNDPVDNWDTFALDTAKEPPVNVSVTTIFDTVKLVSTMFATVMLIVLTLERTLRSPVT